MVRRTRRDPKPRFKPDRTQQLDGVLGCPSVAVPDPHPSRDVSRFVEGLDLSSLEQQYSSLGRHGHHPKRVLAVWLYASLCGLHEATVVERACTTDIAFRFLSGGHTISAGTLKRFRQNHRALFELLLTETVRLAHVEGLIVTEELATDSMRLRADASIHQVGTLKRSRQRLVELEGVDLVKLPERERTLIEKKLAKHRAVIASCEANERTSVVMTNPGAALMKFPNGAGAPGHRITATAAGVNERIVVSVLVDASPTDDGKLGAAVQQAREVLVEAGVPLEGLQLAADAGYFCETDLAFASANRDWIDILIAEGTTADVEPPAQGRKGYFDRARFKILNDGSAICPAERAMTPPRLMSDGRTTWMGIGCQQCSLRPQCTPRHRRALTADLDLERVRNEMRRRLAEEGARERYAQRIATIEPVFANIADNMRYKRASSRHPSTIVTEVLLKVVAHNLSRIAAARRVACVRVPLEL